jgi:hypothetical protein
MKGNETSRRRVELSPAEDVVVVACCLDEIAVPFMFLQASHSLFLFAPASCLNQLVIT